MKHEDFYHALENDIKPVNEYFRYVVQFFNSVSKIILDGNGFCFTSLCDWSRKLAPLSQPIRWITSTNHALVARVFRALVSLVGFT